MVKEIYIKRELTPTKEGTGFFCSQVFEVTNISDFDLSKPHLNPLIRNNKPVYILEKESVAIPKGKYEITKDFTGKHKWAKIAKVLDRAYIEIHAGNYLRNTIGCPLVGQNYDESKQYSNKDIIINESTDTCNWLINDFFLNDENKKQTKKVDQDEVIGHITIA